MHTMSGDQDDVLSIPFSVSSLVSEGGLPASPPGTTRGGMADSTPSGTPCNGVTQLQGKKTVSTQTQSFCVNTFSSKTCLELLIDDKLSLNQIQHEANYLSSLSHGRQARVRDNLTNATHKHIMNEVRATLAHSVCIDYQAAENRHQLTLQNFSYLVEQAQKEVDKLIGLNAAVSAKDWSPDIDTAITDAAPNPDIEAHDPDNEGPGDAELPNSVCELNELSFAEFNITDVLDQIPITEPSSCGRKVSYFGSRGYSYGNVHHNPRDYPDCTVMNAIIAKMKTVDPSFSVTDFSCLVTVYPDGRATIPAHSDNESHIKPDSKIWTLSFGASREMEFVRRTGSLQEHRVTLSHGQLFSMSADSQADWSHELLYNPSIREARVSFTFRHTIDPSPKPPAPPMEMSAPPRSHKRKILFLTDSVLYSTPEFLFGRIRNHRCIKQRNYYLTDIARYEEEFRHSRIVLLSMGINDLSTSSEGRPQLSGEELGVWASRKLRLFCQKYQNTSFSVSSILHTRHTWLNAEVDTYNSIIQHLAESIPNLHFVNSHAAIIQDRISHRIDYVLDKHDPRGTHLTLAAKKVVARKLVSVCQNLGLNRLGNAGTRGRCG